MFSTADVDVRGGRVLDVQLSIAQEAQAVTVEDDQHSIGTDPNQNAGALILRQEELKSLSDDPDQLASELQALAGPGARPMAGRSTSTDSPAGVCLRSRRFAKCASIRIRIRRSSTVSDSGAWGCP